MYMVIHDVVNSAFLYVVQTILESLGISAAFTPNSCITKPLSMNSSDVYDGSISSARDLLFPRLNYSFYANNVIVFWFLIRGNNMLQGEESSEYRGVDLHGCVVTVNIRSSSHTIRKTCNVGTFLLIYLAVTFYRNLLNGWKQWAMFHLPMERFWRKSLRTVSRSPLLYILSH